MKVSSAMPKSEAQWQAEDDANTLARAAEIQGNKKRLSAAAKAASKMVDEAQTRVTAMKRISKKAKSKKSPKKAAKKATRRKKK